MTVRRNYLLKTLRIVFGIMTALFALYTMLTDNHTFLTLTYFFLGMMFLMMALTVQREKEKSFSYILFSVAGFNIVGSLYVFIFDR